MNIRPAFATLVLAAGLTVAASASANDLLRIYHLALTNDAELAAQLHRRDAALEVEPAARALLLPQISASYSLQFNDSSVDVTYTDPITGLPIALQRDNNSTDRSLGVQAQQTLFNLEYWLRLKQAGDKVTLAQLNYRLREQELVQTVVADYIDLLAAHDQLDAAKAEAAAVGEQLVLVTNQLAQGLSSKTDLQDVQARHDLASANVLSAREQLALARLALAQLTEKPLLDVDQASRPRVVPLEGADPDRLGVGALGPDIALPGLQPAGMQDWVNLGAQTALGLITAKLNYKVADREVSIARSKHLPVLSATASYANTRTGGGTFPTRANGPALQVGVTVPIFSGGAVASQVRESIATREQRTAEYDAAQRQLVREVSSAWQSATTGANRIQALRQALKSSRLALESEQVGMSIGTRSTLDLLNAQKQVFAAQRDYSRARYDYLLSLLRLSAAAGRLGIGNVVAIDALLSPATGPVAGR